MNEKKPKRERLLRSMRKGIIVYKGLKDVHNTLKIVDATEPIESAESQPTPSVQTLELTGEQPQAQQILENSVESAKQTEKVPNILPEAPPETPVTTVAKPDPQPKNETNKKNEHREKESPKKSNEKKRKDIYWYAALAGILSTVIAIVSLINSFYMSDPEPQPSGNNATSQISQKGYVNTVQEASKSEVIYYEYNDYDDDGEPEMFAVVGDEELNNKLEGDYNSVYYGVLWFVNKNGAVKLFQEAKRISGQPSTIMLENKPFFYLEEYYDTGGLVYLWGVIDKEPFEFSISGKSNGFTVNNYNEVEIIGEDYSSGYYNGILSGHTWITYYLYFNGKDFREYGGMKISWDELCRCPGIESIINKIYYEKISRGWKIGDIFYRENGVININFYTGTDNITYEYKTIRIWKGSIIEDQYFYSDYGEGICKKAFLENIATYPEAYPY